MNKAKLRRSRWPCVDHFCISQKISPEFDFRSDEKSCFIFFTSLAAFYLGGKYTSFVENKKNSKHIKIRLWQVLPIIVDYWPALDY